MELEQFLINDIRKKTIQQSAQIKKEKTQQCYNQNKNKNKNKNKKQNISDIDDNELMSPHTKITKPFDYNDNDNRNQLTHKEMIEEHEKSLSIKPSLRPIPSIEISNKQPIICRVKNKHKSSVDSVREKIDTTKNKLNEADRAKLHKKKKRISRNESYSDGTIRRSKRLRV